MTRRTLPALDRLIWLLVPTLTGDRSPTNHPIPGQPVRRQLWAARLESETETDTLDDRASTRAVDTSVWLIRYDPAVRVGLTFEDDAGRQWGIVGVAETGGRRRFMEVRAS